MFGLSFKGLVGVVAVLWRMVETITYKLGTQTNEQIEREIKDRVCVLHFGAFWRYNCQLMEWSRYPIILF